MQSELRGEKRKLNFYRRLGTDALRKRSNSSLARKKLAEREGFEPPVRFPVHLISSQAPSTGLGHLSAAIQLVTRLLCGSQFLWEHPGNNPAEMLGENGHHLFVWRIDIALVD